MIETEEYCFLAAISTNSFSFIERLFSRFYMILIFSDYKS
ncbi:unnamed protein product, partial [Arabidopsis halleri]